MPSNLHEDLRAGARAVIFLQIASQVVTYGVLAVLYRLLGPEPYGVMAMVMTFLLFLRILIPGGLDVAAVQRSELSAQQVSAMFWMNQLLGVGVALTAVGLAPFWADFFGVEAVFPLTSVLGTTAIIIALGTQHQALLQRNLRLGELQAIRLASQVIGGGAAIAAALAGWGVWALVVQQYIEPLALTVLAWWRESWRPSWTLRRAGSRPLMKFGGYVMASSLMVYLTANMGHIMIGRLPDAREASEALGLFGLAFSLMMKPVQVLTTPLAGIMLPALSKTVFDPKEFGGLFLGFCRTIVLFLTPIGVGLAVVADEAVAVLGGPKWSGAAVMVTALCGATVFQGFIHALGSVLASAGRPRRLFLASFVIAVVMCSGFYVGLRVGYRVGEPGGAPQDTAALGVAISYTATTVLFAFPAFMHFCLRTIGISWRQWAGKVLPACGAALAMGGVVAACRVLLVRYCALPPFGMLAIEVAIGAGVYAWFARNEIAWLIRLNRSEQATAG